MILSQLTRSSLLILASALGASAFPISDGPSVFAPDAAGALQKRAIMKGDNYVPFPGTTVPLSMPLLILAGLAAAVVGLVIALIRITVPSFMSRSSRIVLEERERARQDLRVRGAISPRGSPGGSPTPGGSTPTHAHARRFPPNKPMRPVGRNSRGSFPRGESSSSTLVNKRPSHGYRGTSFSIKEARRNTDRSFQSSLSGLQLPLLNSSDTSSGSSTLHVNARDSTMSERAKYPITATNEPHAPRNGGGRSRLNFGTSHLQRTSSIGKGADLHRTRSGRDRPEIALQPRPVVPAYAHSSRRGDSSAQHPLQTAYNRRDSTLSMGEVSSSAGHSYLDSTATSRIGSFSNMSGNPLQPMSMPGFAANPHHNQPWASPRSSSRSPSLEYGSPDPSRLAASRGGATGNSRNSSVSGLLDSDGSDHSAPHTAVLIPSRATSGGRF